ncbi:hypothetical protein [Pseudomonas sp. 273]|uniref:hypothetical protein n=1 Tax=Pseudomonas sp. 273 TaxID=75692 RepID=UPI0023D8BBE1|nr:hypothetical protein [Pseudomonas sp. 273]
MARKKTAGKAAAPAAAATAEQQANLPAGASDATAAPAATVQASDEPAAPPVASAGTPGLAAVEPALDTTFEQPTASELASAGPQAQEQPGVTHGQDAHLGQQTEDAAPAPGAALQPVAGAGELGEDEEVEALFIRSVPESFRRCGHRFTREGHGIALSLLSDRQVEALLNDPNLVVEHCSFPLKDVS